MIDLRRVLRVARRDTAAPADAWQQAAAAEGSERAISSRPAAPATATATTAPVAILSPAASDPREACWMGWMALIRFARNRKHGQADRHMNKRRLAGWLAAGVAPLGRWLKCFCRNSLFVAGSCSHNASSSQNGCLIMRTGNNGMESRTLPVECSDREEQLESITAAAAPLDSSRSQASERAIASQPAGEPAQSFYGCGSGWGCQVSGCLNSRPLVRSPASASQVAPTKESTASRLGSARHKAHGRQVEISSVYGCVRA